ncbi:hypothetical protein [Photobacterium piscicola]|uniref:hypothetical protein n=1 Tax=Photobacterium piscicola TaxID=1378299 RepID=UPI0038D13C6E
MEASNFNRILIKFMDEQYIDFFLDEGTIYMNTVNYFKNYESNDVAVRADIYEGLAATFNSKEMVISYGGVTAKKYYR